MILSRWQGQLLVVRQPDHGVQTGLFAADWGNEEVAPLADHVRAATLAAGHHDDGWAIWERHPTLDDDTGQPVQFHAVGPIEHIAAYRAGIERAAQLDPWTGLLVSMHGAGLYNDRYGTYRLAELVVQDLTAQERSVVEEFLSDMAALQHRLAGLSLGHQLSTPAVQDPTIRHHYLLLQVWDRLSLQFAYRHAADEVITPLPVVGGTDVALRCRADGPMALTLDPYPFRTDRATFPVRAYQVPDRRYRSPEEFVSTLAGAERLTLDCTVSRPR